MHSHYLSHRRPTGLPRQKQVWRNQTAAAFNKKLFISTELHRLPNLASKCANLVAKNVRACLKLRTSTGTQTNLRLHFTIYLLVPWNFAQRHTDTHTKNKSS